MNLKRAIGGPLLSFIFIILFVYVISGINWTVKNPLRGASGKVFLGSVSAGAQNIQTSVAPVIERPEINAAAAISVEGNLLGENKIVFDKDSDKQLPIASLTKLMTAVIVLDNYNLSDTAEVNKAADSQDPMKQDLKLGDIMPVESFLDIMLVGSSNKAAYALAELAGEQKFVDLMNQKAKGLELKNTFFADPTGLSSQNVSTTSDLVRLAEYILKNYPRIANISMEKEVYVPNFGTVTNTDQLLGEIPEIICSKTGFTEMAKGCLLLVTSNQKNNGYIINVVLGAEDRFAEMRKLINWSLAVCN